MPGNLKRIYLVTFCTHFHFYIHVYALLLLSRGLNLVQVSAIGSVVIAVIFLMEVPTGVLADRLGRKWAVVGSMFCLMWAEFIFLFSRNYETYLFVAFLTGTGFAFTSGAIESLVYDSLPTDNRAQRMKVEMGKVGSAKQMAVFLSPLIGGLIVSDLTQAQFDLAISLTVMILLTGLIVGLTLREPPSESRPSQVESLAILREGMAELRRNHRLKRLTLLVILTAPFTGMMVTTLVPPYLRQWQITPFLIGLAMSVGNLVAAFTQRWAHLVETKLGQRWGLTFLTLLPGLGYLLLAVTIHPFLAWLIVVWMYGSNDMRQPLISAYQNEWIATGSRATVLSLVNMLLSLFVALMMPVYAALASRSLSLAFLAMSAVILVAGSVLLVNPSGYRQFQ
jgi:MFS family permease